MKQRPLILLELNEVNLDIAARYVEPLGLTNLGLLLRKSLRSTSAESRYAELEPWIQWVSVHSGLDGPAHGIFRLGDIVGSAVPQFFEQLESAGLRIGAVSPMNAANRLKAPAYFLPDPWTHTPTDSSAGSRRLWEALSQVVNDNASGRLTARSAATLVQALLRHADPQHYGLYFSLGRRAVKSSWCRALLLDLFLHDLHMRMYRQHRPDLSVLFLNAGAHIQHHYLFNARHGVERIHQNPPWYVDPEADPVADMLRVYDRILGDYLALQDTALLVATGLTQVPYDRIKYYWRLRDHTQFLETVGVRPLRVLPRMTRDFALEFATDAQAAAAQLRLASLQVVADSTPLFQEIDNRGNSLFVTLTYGREIDDSAEFSGEGVSPQRLRPHVVFVAIKNGMHSGRGFVAASDEIAMLLPPDGAHVKELYGTVMRYFGCPVPEATLPSRPPVHRSEPLAGVPSLT
jgi:hypothetical protein